MFSIQSRPSLFLVDAEVPILLYSNDRKFNKEYFWKEPIFRVGLFPLFKEKFITSAETVTLVKNSIIKDIDQENECLELKVGHGGTLDKPATGVLVIGLGWGCKYLTQLLQGNKEYHVIGKLGLATDTYNDAGLPTLEAPYGHITEELFFNTLNTFKGRILQVPPKYSALKVHGKRIADRIRNNEQIEPRARYVDCHSLSCSHFDPPHFTLQVSCGGGFYVRSLVHDLGKAVGSAAHVTELCRVRQGPFSEEDCLTVDQLCLDSVIESVKTVQKQYAKELVQIKTELRRKKHRR